jgi:hypothetical protein
MTLLSLLCPFLLGEVRYHSVKKAYPNEAEELFAEAQKMAQLRYKSYVRKSQEELGGLRKRVVSGFAADPPSITKQRLVTHMRANINTTEILIIIILPYLYKMNDSISHADGLHRFQTETE